MILHHRDSTWGMVASCIAMLALLPSTALAIDIQVTTPLDAPLYPGAVDCRIEAADEPQACSLRAALTLAGNVPIQDLPVNILLPAGEYRLENTNLGPLDIPRPEIAIVGLAATPGDVVLTTDPAFGQPMIVSSGMFSIDPDAATPLLRNLTLRGARNTTVASGGAVDCKNSRLAVERVRFVDNHGVAAGALRADHCYLRVAGSEFAQNVAAGPSSEVWAGAIDIGNASIVDISESSLVENRSSVVSALRARQSLVRLSSVSIHDNTATSFNGATLHFSATEEGSGLNNVSVIRNRIDSGSSGTPGLATSPSVTSHLTVSNSVIAGNVLGGTRVDVRAGDGLVSLGNNRIGKVIADDPAAFSAAGDMTNLPDAEVGPDPIALAPWGFPHGFEPVASGVLHDAGSVANGVGACALTDAGGRKRLPLGTACDIGAVERFERPAVWAFDVDSTADAADALPGDGTCAAPTAQGLRCSLRAATQEANALFADGHYGPYRISLDGAQIYLLNQTVLVGGFMESLSITAEDLSLEGPLEATPPVIKANATSDVMLAIRHQRWSHGGFKASRLILDGAQTTTVAAGCVQVGDGSFDGIHVRNAQMGITLQDCDAEIEDSRLYDNGEGTGGGAIQATATELAIRRSAIFHTDASGGFAIAVGADGSVGTRSALTLLSSSIVANDVAVPLSLYETETVIWNSTIAGNAIPSGTPSASVIATDSVVAVSHSVFADSGAPEDLQALNTTVHSYGSNLFAKETAPADYQQILGVPDRFGQAATGLEAFVEGPAWAGLMPISLPARDGGALAAVLESATISSGLCLAYDQRNLSRKDDAAGNCDVGALEFFEGQEPEPEPDPDSDDEIFLDGFE